MKNAWEGADLIRRVLSAIARMATEEGYGMID